MPPFVPDLRLLRAVATGTKVSATPNLSRHQREGLVAWARLGDRGALRGTGRYELTDAGRAAMGAGAAPLKAEPRGAPKKAKTPVLRRKASTATTPLNASPVHTTRRPRHALIQSVRIERKLPRIKVTGLPEASARLYQAALGDLLRERGHDIRARITVELDAGVVNELIDLGWSLREPVHHYPASAKGHFGPLTARTGLLKLMADRVIAEIPAFNKGA